MMAQKDAPHLNLIVNVRFVPFSAFHLYLNISLDMSPVQLLTELQGLSIENAYTEVF